MNIEQKLQDLKARNEQAKNSLARVEGQLQSKLEEMQKLGCNTIEELDTKILELEAETTKKQEELHKKLEELNEYITD